MAGNGQVRVRKDSRLAEIGTSGLRQYGGRVRDEFHPRLLDDRARKVYREMADNDPVVGSILFAIDMLVREVGWSVEPADDDPPSEELATFVQQALNDMNRPWEQVVSAILSFLPFGWSWFNVVYKFRRGDGEDARYRSEYDDGRLGWRKWALRSQESLVRWDFDEQGGVRAMIQSTEAGQVPIPIEASLLFRTTAAKESPEGRSILRNAYRPWYLKKRIEEVEGIGIERDLAGLPIARVPPEYLDPQAPSDRKDVLQAVKEIVRDVKRDEQEGIVFPLEYDEDGNRLWDLELLATGGRRQFDTDAIIARYDQRIAMTVLADFILLGHEKVGSRSLGVSKIELFTVALSAWVDEIAAVVNQYGIPRLLRQNGIAVPGSRLPKLVPSEVKDVDLKDLGDYITAIAGAGAPLFPDDELEAHLRNVAGLPQRDAESVGG